MTTVIVLSLLAGAALSLYFNWLILVSASPAVMLFAGVSELMNGSTVGFAFLSAMVAATALQAGYLGGALIQLANCQRRGQNVPDGGVRVYRSG